MRKLYVHVHVRGAECSSTWARHLRGLLFLLRRLRHFGGFAAELKYHHIWVVQVLALLALRELFVIVEVELGGG